MKTTADLQNRIDELEGLVIELQDSLSQEQRRSSSKSQFIATGAHEFRTPLTTILNSADFLEMVGRSCSEEKYLEHIFKIKTAVTYLAEFSEDVMTISKIETRNSLLKSSQFSPEEFFRRLLDELSDTKRSHTFSFNYVGEMKCILHDKHLLQQIILNLLENSIKYSPHGKCVELNVTLNDHYLELSVRDEGRGIAEEDQPRLFQPFERGSNTSDTLGTGLGLFIVKKSVDIMHGTISVQSSLNNGTTITVKVPLLEYTTKS